MLHGATSGGVLVVKAGPAEAAEARASGRPVVRDADLQAIREGAVGEIPVELEIEPMPGQVAADDRPGASVGQALVPIEVARVATEVDARPTGVAKRPGAGEGCVTPFMAEAEMSGKANGRTTVRAELAASDEPVHAADLTVEVPEGREMVGARPVEGEIIIPSSRGVASCVPARTSYSEVESSCVIMTRERNVADGGWALPSARNNG